MSDILAYNSFLFVSTIAKVGIFSSPKICHSILRSSLASVGVPDLISDQARDRCLPYFNKTSFVWLPVHLAFVIFDQIVHVGRQS